MQKLLDELRLLFAQIATGEGDSQEHVRRGLELLDQLSAPSPVASFKLVRGGTEVEYTVETAANGETLTERRKTGAAKPHRCPKPIYDALVQVLSSADRALPLDELVAAIGKVMGDEPPDFQIRVPLRLWMQVEPPLIVRNRARYRPTDVTAFTSTATSLWATLRTP